MNYKGVPAITLENEMVKATFLPSYGGKLCSFYDKQAQYEWLFQSDETELQVPSYGANFSHYDASGFDEVFPSIDASFHPLHGQPVPDHGEVWAMPWECIQYSASTLLLRVNSPVFPYTLVKEVELVDNGLHFSYTAINGSDDDFAFIWTPHALLNMDEHTRIILPPDLNEVMNVEHSSHHLGEWGTRHRYPITKHAHTDERLDLSTFALQTKQCEKFYFTTALKEGWCGVLQENRKRELHYQFPTDKVPYLGIWKTEGGYRGHYNFALEPCTGVYDDVYVAHKQRKVSTIPANGCYEWYFNMVLK
ncbi:DUF5107 domain-containing protein [Longirhabdus pacifica]|uniref:DUF5107 domain-containing protein n=1 Tax=Longirhabdus pacifica TaxID=2305227 RepID=UPI001F0C06A9|nr:DUF5107 domain-containing protein [Longirhabdus pacifica]